MSTNTKAVFKIMSLVMGFYLTMMMVWNFSNKEHKPSHLLIDWKKEGYKENPLHDRKTETLLGTKIQTEPNDK